MYKIAEQALAEKKTALYVNFEDEILCNYSLGEIYYVFLQRMPIDYLLADEIQQCHDWVPFIRKAYDRKDIKQIWLTGSNSSLIKKEYSQLLTGRNLKIQINPLSFSEYLLFKGIPFSQLPLSKTQESIIIKHFNDYLQIGSFPEIALRDDLQRSLLIISKTFFILPA